MERKEEWNEGTGDKLFVCKKEWEGKWKLEKLKVWKLGVGNKIFGKWEVSKFEK